MHGFGRKDDVVAFFLKGDDRLRVAGMAGMECDAKTTADQHRDRRGMPVGPGLRSLFAVRVDAPLDLDIGLMPEAEIGRDELAYKPAAAADLIGDGIAEIK